MNLEQFRANEKLVAWANNVFNSPNGKVFVQMLNEAHPRHWVLTGVHDQPEAALALGRIYGYDIAMNTLASACEFRAPVVPLTETYGVGMHPVQDQLPGFGKMLNERR